LSAETRAVPTWVFIILGLIFLVALAHKIQNAIGRGVVRDCADVAMRLGLSRARISQLLDLTLLAPDIQEQILLAESVDGVEPMSESALREVVRLEDWAKQREVPSLYRG